MGPFWRPLWHNKWTLLKVSICCALGEAPWFQKGPNFHPFGLSEDIFSVNGSILASALARQMDTFKSVHLLCFGRGPMATKRVPIKIHLGFQRAPARHTTTITAKQQQTIAAHHHNRNKSATTTTPFKQPPLIRHRRNKAETKASTPFKKNYLVNLHKPLRQNSHNSQHPQQISNLTSTFYLHD